MCGAEQEDASSAAILPGISTITLEHDTRKQQKNVTVSHDGGHVSAVNRNGKRERFMTYVQSLSDIALMML